MTRNKNRNLHSIRFLLTSAVVTALWSLLLLHPAALNAQPVPAQWNFSNLMCDSEWKHLKSNCITRDNDGFVWVGTNNGLYRYDGYKFHLFPMARRADNHINDICVTSHGILVGTLVGLSVYDSEELAFRRVVIPSTSPSEQPRETNIRTIFEASDSTLYLGSDNGIYLIDKDFNLKTHLLFPDKGAGKRSNIVRTVTEDSHGNIWIGTYDGLYRYTPSDESLTFVNTARRELSDPLNNLILSLAVMPDRKECLLVGRETGLTLLDLTTLEFEVLRQEYGTALSNNVIKTIQPVGTACYVLGTDNGLNILRLDDRSVRTLFHETDNKWSLGNNVVTDLCLDRGNRLLWLATDSGVSKAELSKRLEIREDRYTDRSIYFDITGLDKDRNGDLWISTRNGLLKTRDGKVIRTCTTADGLRHNNCSVLFRDSDDVLWIGTINGLNYLSGDRLHTATEESRKCKYVRNVHQTADGRIWVVTLDHIFRWDKTTERLYTADYRTDSLPRNLEMLTSTNDDSNIWIGTNNGIYRFDTRNSTLQEIDTQIEANEITAVAMHDNVLIWGTNFGVFAYDTRQKRNLDFRFNNRPMSIRQITIHRDICWIVTTKEMVRYDIKEQTIREYNYIQDLPLADEAPSICYASTGRIHLGGYGRIISFDDRTPAMPVRAPLRIAEIVRDYPYGERINPNRPIELQHDTKNIRISLSLLNYSRYNKYAFKLDGYDDQWHIQPLQRRSVTYKQLPAGNYLLHTKAMNADGLWSEELPPLPIRVLAPWWETPYAYLLYFLAAALFAGGVSLVVKYRVRKLEKRRMEELRQENLKELNEMRMQFFANVSHEFKTPLSLILGPMEVISDRLAGDLAIEPQLRIMQKNVERLMRLGRQVMTLCKLENREMILNRQMGDIVRFTQNIFEMFVPQSRQRNITMEFNSEFETASMLFDEDKMEHILYNLLDNALKFTPDGGVIALSLRNDPQRQESLLIEVRDSGSGIAPDDCRRIFDKFFQGENSRLENKQGTGIGLNIVKQFVEMHDGQITVDSTPGKGTKFTISLPDFHLSHPAEETSVEAVNDECPTLLVAEDNADMREYIRLNLGGEYNILEAANGVEAWRLAREYTPDIIISDILMPEMDGLELCRKVRAEFQTGHIPVVMLTALTSEMKLKESLEAGANSFITKPFSIKVLRLKIQRLIADRRLLQERLRIEVLQQPRSVETQSRDEIFIRNFVEVVEKHIDNPDLDVEMICRELGYSHQQTYRKVHAVTGKNINSFIRYVRINRAAQLLRDTDMSLQDIMDYTGFSNRSYFYRVFKEEFSASPSDYKKRCAAESSPTDGDTK